MYLEPDAGREVEHDRETPIGEWFGAGKADITFESIDKIVYGERTFDIIGPPRPIWNPRTQAVSHIEMDLREVT